MCTAPEPLKISDGDSRDRAGGLVHLHLGPPGYLGRQDLLAEPRDGLAMLLRDESGPSRELSSAGDAHTAGAWDY